MSRTSSDTVRQVRAFGWPGGGGTSTWTTAKPVEHGPDPEPDRFEELRRNLLLGGA